MYTVYYRIIPLTIVHVHTILMTVYTRNILLVYNVYYRIIPLTIVHVHFILLTVYTSGHTTN